MRTTLFRRLSPLASSPWSDPLRACPTLEPLEDRILLSAQPGLAYPGYRLADSNSSSPTGLVPAQVRHAYAFDQIGFLASNSNSAGSGQTIAIVDAYDDPNIAGDLHAFDLAFGLPDPSLVKVAQNGSTNLPAPNHGWATEIALDVEWAHALAPSAQILLVEAYSNSDTNLFAAVDYARHQPGVAVVSMSWGGSESSSQLSWDSYLQTPVGHSGVTFVVSSGDSGVIEFPSSSVNAVGVGGTTLTLTASNAILNETAWSGSGGGVSTYEALPPYQNGFAPQGSTGRTAPDVAYDADPNTGVSVYDSYNGGAAKPWYKVGGTSAGAPQWAALFALADQGRALNGMPALDGGTQTLPLLYHLPPSAFHDITSGHNLHYNAGPGYDLVTGRGSPVANLIVAGLDQPIITTADGTTYTLDSNGVLWHYNAAGWTALDGGVVSINIFPGGTSVYVLENGGNLRLFNGSAWGQVDTGVVSFGLAGASLLYDLRSDGTLSVTDLSQGGWTSVDSGVLSFGVAANAQVYLVDNATNLWQYSPSSGLVQLTTGVSSFRLPLSTTTVLVRMLNGDLVQYDWSQGSWTTLDNVRRPMDFVILPDNQVYVGATSNGQWQPDALVAPGQVKALSAGQDALGFPELFVIGLDNQIWAVKLDANGVAQSGYFLTTAGAVQALSAGQDASGRPLVFALGLNGQVYAEHFDLLGNGIGTYSFVVTGQVKSFSAGRDAFGRPLVFAVGLNDQVYAAHLDGLGNVTAGYTFVTAGSVKAITLGRDDQGNPELYVIGLNDQVYRDPLDALGNSTGVYTFFITGSVKAVSRGPGDQLLAIGLDDQVYADQLDGQGQALSGYLLTVAGPVKALNGAL